MSIPNLTPEQVDGMSQDDKQNLYDNMTELEAERFDLEQYSKRWCKAACDRVVQIMYDTESDKTALRAAEIIMDRAAGKPTEHLKHEHKLLQQQVVMLRHGADALPDLNRSEN